MKKAFYSSTPSLSCAQETSPLAGEGRFSVGPQSPEASSKGLKVVIDSRWSNYIAKSDENKGNTLFRIKDKENKEELGGTTAPDYHGKCN